MANFISVTPILATGLLIGHPNVELNAPSLDNHFEKGKTQLAQGAPQTPQVPQVPQQPWLPWLPWLPTGVERPKPNMPACKPWGCVQVGRISLEKDSDPIPFPVLKVEIRV